MRPPVRTATASDPRKRASSLLMAFLLVAGGLVVLGAPTVSAAAKATKVTWLDEDTNGHIDAVQLDFGAPGVKVCTVRPPDFVVTFPSSTTGVRAHSVTPSSAPPCSGTTNTFKLLFPEAIDVDGGSQAGAALPTLAYSRDPEDARAMKDGANAPVEDFTTGTCPNTSPAPAIQCVDAVKPILMGVYAKTGDTYLTAVFSEPIRKKAGSGAGAVPDETDLCLTGDAAVTIGNGAPGAAKPSFNTAGSPSQRVLLIPLDFSSGSGLTALLDDHVRTGGAVQLRLSVTGSCNGKIADVQPALTPAPSANDAVNRGGATDVPVVAPTISAIHASEGSKKLLVEYTGPVYVGSGSGGQSIPYSGSGSVFTLACAPSMPCTSGIAVDASVPAIAPAGSDRNLVTLNAPLSADDIDNLRVRVNTGASIPAGYATGSTVRGAVNMPCTDPPVTTGGLYPCGADQAIKVSPFALKDNAGVAAPHVTSMAGGCGYKPFASRQPFIACPVARPTGLETVDTDTDGRLDGIKVLFTETMKAFGSAGDWCVQHEADESVCRSLSSVSGTLPGDSMTLMFNTACAINCADRSTGARFRVSYIGTAAKDQADVVLPAFHKWPTTDAAIPVLMESKSNDSDHDGFIDSMLLRFSESIQDSSFRAPDWTVELYTVSGHNTACPDVTTADDDCMLVSVTEKTVTMDTGVRPKRSYLRSAPSVPILDISGLPFRSNLALETMEDGAQPILKTVTGVAGATKITLTFSEPVIGSNSGSSPPGALVPSDLRYLDSGSSGGASGISSISDPLRDTTADAFANNPLKDPGDLGSGADRICPTATIKDMAVPPNSVHVPTDALCVYLAKGNAPVLSTATTVDANHDGYLDAIMMSFSEAIRDGNPAVASPVLRVDVPPLDVGAAYKVAADRFYGDLDDSGTVSPGDFRYAACPAFSATPPPAQSIDAPCSSVKAAGSTVVSGDGDITPAYSPISTSTIVRADGGDGTVSLDDMLYIDPSGAGLVCTSAAVGCATGRVSEGLVRAIACTALHCGSAKAAETVVTAGPPADGDVISDGLQQSVARGAMTASLLNPNDWQVSFGSRGFVPVTGVVTGDKTKSKPGCGSGFPGVARGDLLPDVPDDSVIFLCIRPLRLPFSSSDPFPYSGNPVPNTAFTPFVNYTNPNGITDRAGTAPLGKITNFPATDGAQPVLMSVQGGAGVRVVTLTFSEGVRGSNQGKLSAADLTYINGCSAQSACGASNVASVDAHPADDDQATVSLNAALTACDISGPVPGTACAGVGARDCMRPRASTVETNSAGGKAAFVPTGCVAIVDDREPYVRSASIMDVTGDGIVDAIQVQWSEPVNDAQVLDSKKDLWTAKVAGTVLLVTHFVTRSTVAGGAAENCPGLDLAPTSPANDDLTFLCLDTSENLAQHGTKDLGTGIQATRPWSLTWDWAGDEASRIRDLASPPNKAAAIGPNSPTTDKQPAAVGDLARPVVTAVDTADTNGNGRVDAMRVTFSEPVIDSPPNFVLGEWTVTGRQLKGQRVSGADAIYNDDVIDLLVQENSVPDSGVCSRTNDGCPDVSYVAGGTLSDSSGNTVRSVAGGSCAVTIGTSQGAGGCIRERDRARPVITEVRATNGSATVTIVYSEAVGDSDSTPPGAIRPANFDYQDKNPGGASGVVNVVHTAGENKSALSLNQVVSGGDFSKDCIAIQPGAIVEFYEDPGTDSPANRMQAGTSCYLLDGTSIDTIPPAAIVDLRVADTHLTTMTLNWTTPGDKDIKEFELRYCQPGVGGSPLTCIRADSDFNLGTKAPASMVPAPKPGAKQQATLTGLRVNTSYCVAIKAIDNAGNFGTWSTSTPVCGTTLQNDTKAPGAIRDLKVGGTSAKSVALEWKAPGDDDLGGGAVKAYIIAACKVDPVGNNSKFTGCITSRVSFSPPILAGANQQQTATVSGTLSGDLAASTKHWFAVRAVDEVGNLGPISTWIEATTIVTPDNDDDITPPGPVLNLNATKGANLSVVLSFTAPADIGTGIARYVVRQAEQQIANTTMFEDALDATTATVTLVATGETQSITVNGLSSGKTYHFAVAAVDGDGNQGPASASVSITLKAAVTTDQLKAVNSGMDVDVSSVAGGMEVRWTLPGDAPVGVAGVQVWRKTNGTWVQVTDVPAGSDGFTKGRIVDASGTSDSEYRVTAYYGRNAAEGFNANDPTGLPGFNEQGSATARGTTKVFGMPLWLALILLLLVLLAVVAVVVLLVRRGKGTSEAAPAEEADAYAPPPEDMPIDTAASEEPPMELPPDAVPEPGPAAAAPAAAAGAAQASVPADAPVHYVNCPKCATQFSAQGFKPLAIRCPSCGVRGVLR